MQDYGMKKNTPRHADPEITKELRALRKAHPELARDTDATKQMERLASMRVKFKQLDAAIQAAGGAATADVEQLSELRQLSKACSALETQLRRWFAPPSGVDAFALMASVRRQLLGLPAPGDDVIDGAIEPVEHVRLPRN